jgi:thioredoxin 1
MASTILELSDATFDEEVLGSDLPVIVDFTAEWCGPCKTLAPVLESLAEEYGDRVRVLSLDVDANPATTARFEVMSMPTLIVFKDGEQQRRLVGARPKGVLLKELQEYL